MPGPLLHVGAVLTCPHTGPVTPQTGNARVLVGGLPVVTATDAYPVTGCPFQVPVGAGTKPQPCVQLRWTTPAARVLVNGQPAVLATSVGLGISAEGIPQGPPTVAGVQVRAVAS
ncbi:hypothetical protein ACQP2H_14575 [Micromonospora sp. CA-248260]|uniref:hypothetical protein n=1 Tax=unclassified Micromonospora TaxID=2617518 RepID=UPI003416084C